MTWFAGSAAAAAWVLAIGIVPSCFHVLLATSYTSYACVETDAPANHPPKHQILPSIASEVDSHRVRGAVAPAVKLPGQSPELAGGASLSAMLTAAVDVATT